MSAVYTKCGWCGKQRSRFSDWEQKSSHGWLRLCNPCATRRLNNPYNALLNMRRIETT